MKRGNIYQYANFSIFDQMNLTLGLSYDTFTSTISGNRKDKTNPKFGAQWDISQNARLRFAWFETTKSHLIAQQSLEPTQIAGFNQFFDDFNGTRSRRMGIGMDVHYRNKVFGGIEASKRRLHVPQEGDLSVEVLQRQKENNLRAYLYWLPHKHWVIRSEFNFDRFTRSKFVSGTDPIKIETLNIPTRVEYFHPGGFFSKVSATIVRQDLTRQSDFIKTIKQNRIPEKTYSGIDLFFLLDWSIGYRLPKRQGLLSLEIRNLLDKEFFYRNNNFGLSEIVDPRYLPDRTFFVRAALNF